jgi:uncharacterized MAPEG superfamily protein
MTSEDWLFLTCAVTGCFWMPYIYDRFRQLGVARTLGNPGPGDLDQHHAWARRAKLAHANAVENLAVFAPLVLLAVHAGLSRAALVTGACCVYFWARLAHFTLYTLGVMGARTLAFLVGWGALAALALALLQGAHGS